MESILLEDIIKELNLEIIHESSNIGDIKITKSEVNRPGLQIIGYFEYFAYKRLQIIGNVEWYFIHSLSQEERSKRIEEMLSYPLPAIIFARGLDVFPEVIKYGIQNDITILRSNLSTTKLINKIINYLDIALAPEITIHGVLVEVYGMGILLTGDSGVGKSETALELIKRGHRLVADDAVEIKRVDDKLQGISPELVRHFMEIRGIGIIDIERLYGVGAVKAWEFIDLVIELEFWDEKKEYDRLGLDECYAEILGLKVSKLVAPVRPGRNIAMIVEVAARNTRQKNLGYNAAIELDNRIKSYIEEKNKRGY
ncbi:MAG TPA: HPr(Ser) kinase/phosphatase [Tissierellales bacterium]|nr:HPr(Ser) kinase/phosphatase [Tissierellales bacterium]